MKRYPHAFIFRPTYGGRKQGRRGKGTRQAAKLPNATWYVFKISRQWYDLHEILDGHATEVATRSCGFDRNNKPPTLGTTCRRRSLIFIHVNRGLQPSVCTSVHAVQASHHCLDRPLGSCSSGTGSRSSPCRASRRAAPPASCSLFRFLLWSVRFPTVHLEKK